MTGIINSHHTGRCSAGGILFCVVSDSDSAAAHGSGADTPVTMSDVQNAVTQVFPSSVEGLVRSLVAQGYAQSVLDDFHFCFGGAVVCRERVCFLLPQV